MQNKPQLLLTTNLSDQEAKLLEENETLFLDESWMDFNPLLPSSVATRLKKLFAPRHPSVTAIQKPQNPIDFGKFFSRPLTRGFKLFPERDIAAEFHRRKDDRPLKDLTGEGRFYKFEVCPGEDDE